MRKKIVTLNALLIITLGFMACSKEKDNVIQLPDNKPRLVTKFTASNNGNDPYLFKYDAQGRIIETFNGIAGSQKLDYTNNVFSAILADKNNYVYYEFYDGKLDYAGRLLEYKAKYHQPGLQVYHFIIEMTYDVEGYMIKSKRLNLDNNDVSQSVFVYDKGNLISVTVTSNGLPNYRAEYTYNDNLQNKLVLDILGAVGYTWDGLSGKRSKNLVKTKAIFNSLNVKTLDYAYTYEMDALGYPVKYKVNDMISNLQFECTLEYNK